jgi:hypothetical protein
VVSDVRTELHGRLVKRASSDPAFRARLLETPREALAEELGVQLPGNLEVIVIEERPDRIAIVIPADLSGLGTDAVRAMTGRSPAEP